jgi:hypothetical protein
MLTKRQEDYINTHLNQSNKVLAATLGISQNNVRYFFQKYGIRKREIPSVLKTGLAKLPDKEMDKYHSCPRHGKDYLVKEGSAVFCYKETPGEIIDHCFYHVSRGKL